MHLLLSVTSTVRLAFAASEVIHLTVIPAEPILQGANIVIECRVTNVADLFDIVRLVKLSPDGRNNDLAITTNGYLEKPFFDTGRYDIVQWNNTAGLVQLEINGGHFICYNVQETTFIAL